MNIERVKSAQSQDEARKYAIEWQHWQTDVNMSWQEVSSWLIIFKDLAKKFDLVEEFKENGII